MADTPYEMRRRIEFVEQVRERTDGKSLDWEETANDDVFQASIGKLIVRIGEYFDDEERENYFKLDLLNADGRLVESIFPYQVMEGMPRAPLVFGEILGGARRQARKVEETLDSAIKELKALSDEDEIPF